MYVTKYFKLHKVIMIPLFQVLIPKIKAVRVYDSLSLSQHTPAEHNIRYGNLLCLHVNQCMITILGIKPVHTESFLHTCMKNAKMRYFPLMYTFFMKRYEHCMTEL